MRTIIATPIVAGLIGIAALAAPLAAQATTGPGDTATTLVVTGGSLSISAQPTASLTSIAAGATTTSGHLGTVTVADMRGADSGSWAASVQSTAFNNGSTATVGDTIANTAFSYTPGATTANSGSATFTAGTGGAFATDALSAYGASAVIGVASVSWNPTISLAVPSNVVQSSYTGTITHSVA